MRTSETLLTPAQVADAVGLSRGTVYRHIAAGDLPAVRVGHGPRPQLRVRESVLDEWLAPTTELDEPVGAAA
jgi:excisionase family DNA binding protein